MDHSSTGGEGFPPSGRLVVGPQSPSLREVLWDLVRSAKNGDPLAPVTVVSPSRYASLSLRHDLGRRGFANVRFIELPMLAELLGAVHLAGRRPLTELLQHIFLRQVLEQDDGPLAPVKDHRSTQDSLRASFRDLRRLDGNVQAALESRGDVSGAVARLYREYRKATGQDWYDVEDLTYSAAEAVRAAAAPALQDLGQTVFYLPRRISPAQTALLEALAELGWCAVVLGATGDEAADAPVRETLDALKPVMGSPIEIGSGSAPTPQGGEVNVHIAPNTHEELRWVIRQIAAEATEHGTPFHRMAVLYRMENPYGTLVRDELRLAGLPLAGPGRDSLADTGVGRTLTGLLELAESGYTREAVMDWLTGCPILPSGVHESAFNPSRWDSLARSAGVVGGLEQWRERLRRHARRLSEDAERWEADGDITEARAIRMKEEAETARRLLALVEKLAADTKPPEAGRPWTEYCDWARRLLDEYQAPSIRDTEPAFRERIDRILEELKGADVVRPSTTPDEFRRAIADSLRNAVGHLGTTGQGVFVSSFASVAGMEFDVVWLVGMIEGGTPPAVTPDPLLPESSWHAAGGPNRVEERIAMERCDYLLALASAPKRFLSYPVTDAASQRQAHPSRWLLEQASALEGRRVHTSGLARLGDRPWLTVDVSAQQSLAALPGTSLADDHDYRLNRLLRWGGMERPMGRHPLASRGSLLRAHRLGRSRYSESLTEFDGNLSGEDGSGWFGDRLQGSAVSPTSLETWAGCPYRYFLGHVLRLSALETPEETTAITPLERGSLVHHILERFVVESGAAGAIPGPGEGWDENAHRRLMHLAEEAFREAESRGVTGKPLLWDLAKQDIREDLTAFLEEDARLRANNGTVRSFPEERFGLGGDTPEVFDEETGVRFRGIIDRLDASGGESSVMVIDYKTGSNRPYANLEKDPIDRGKRLQLGVYSLAARHLFPDAALVRAAYWFTTTRGGFQFSPRQYFDIEDGATAQRFRDGVSTIVDGIRQGCLSRQPGEPGRPGRAGELPVLRLRLPLSLPPDRHLGTQEERSVAGLLPATVGR